MEQKEIHIADDFDLDKIIASGQCFRPQKLLDGQYRFISGHEVLYIRPNGGGECSVRCRAGAWEDFWRGYFDLSRDYSALRRALSEEEGQSGFLLRALDYGAGIRILRQQPWEMLISFIISQRKSIPAIRSAVEQLAQKYGQAVDTGDETVHFFPTAQALAALPESALAECGLGYRTQYVKNAAVKAASGELDMESLSALSDEALFARLMELYGVGKKVANCVCLFGYGRTAMAPIDVWIQRLIDEEFGGQNPFPGYGAQAGIVQQYMFFYKRQSTLEGK